MELSDLVSVLALSISSVTLGWTLYRESIGRTRFQVRFCWVKKAQVGEEESGYFTCDHPKEGYLPCVIFINTGYLTTSVDIPIIRKSLWRRYVLMDKENTIFTPDTANNLHTPFNTPHEPGKRGQYVFPETVICEDPKSYIAIGVKDTFGRKHWAPKKPFRLFMKSLV